MNGYLVDTNVISEATKPLPNPMVVRWLDQAPALKTFASVITLGELRIGIEGLDPGKRRKQLEDWLESGMPSWFEVNVLPVSSEIADRWAKLTIKVKQAGRSLATADGLIAATALQYSLTLVTRNTSDFAGLQMDLFNPWEA